jgi:hypothetical protein
VYKCCVWRLVMFERSGVPRMHEVLALGGLSCGRALYSMGVSLSKLGSWVSWNDTVDGGARCALPTPAVSGEHMGIGVGVTVGCGFVCRRLLVCNVLLLMPRAGR